MKDSGIELSRLGGEEGITRWMELFYGRIADHPLLARLFPEDLTGSRAKQTAFMIEFFGGEARYTELYGKPFLRYKHRHIKIGVPERDAWMAVLLETLEEITSEPDVIGEVERRVAPLADAMVNHNPQKKDAYYFH